MREADRYTSEELGLSAAVLMERAALTVCKNAADMSTHDSRILVVCGSGNNGGDGFAAARLLLRDHPRTEVFFTGRTDHMTPLCSKQADLYTRLGGTITKAPNYEQYDLIIESMLGIGSYAALRSETVDIIRQINGSGTPVLAVDLPAGISADNGHIAEEAIRADRTVTFQFLKYGHVLYPAAEYCGQIVCEDVGIWQPGSSFAAPVPACRGAFTLEPSDIPLMLPPRKRRSNKGTYGKALIIAGRLNMAGCAVLAVKGAAAMGTGLVKCLSDKENRLILQTCLPSALFAPYAGAEQTAGDLAWADAVCIGPGIGTDAEAAGRLDDVIMGAGDFLVLDADALRLLAGSRSCCIETLRRRKVPAVLTPHPGEMAALCGISVQDVLADIAGHAKKIAAAMHCIVVLKDVGTVVTDGDRLFVNRSGCDGMASGGSGDVLTGMIAGLGAQGMPPFEAACLGVYLHGLAGEAAQRKKGNRSMKADDLPETLAEILSQIP